VVKTLSIVFSTLCSWDESDAYARTSNFTPSSSRAIKGVNRCTSVSSMAAVPALIVGAGTVVSADQVDTAVAAGARFVVSPGFSSAVVRRCHELEVPVLPGVATASELMSAVDAGVTVVKLFPAEPLGGISTVRSLAAAFPQVRFVPSGGISAANAPTYLAEPSVLAVGGSWMVAPSLLAKHSWDEVTQLTAEAVALADRGGPAS